MGTARIYSYFFQFDFVLAEFTANVEDEAGAHSGGEEAADECYYDEVHCHLERGFLETIGLISLLT